MQVIGHRGASATHPENTRAAFEAALAAGADGVECDLHMLADGEIVVLHDDTLRRTASDAFEPVRLAIDAFADIADVHVIAGRDGQVFSHQKGDAGMETPMRLFSATKWVAGVAIMAAVGRSVRCG